MWYQDTFPLLIQRLQSRSHAHRLSDACSAVGTAFVTRRDNEYRVTGPGERRVSAHRGRVVWTVGWFLPVVPHPVAVWEVVVNKDCEMWSHRDGFPGA